VTFLGVGLASIVPGRVVHQPSTHGLPRQVYLGLQAIRRGRPSEGERMGAEGVMSREADLAHAVSAGPAA
jgi:hypothetical protein